MKWPQILHGSKQRHGALLFWRSPGVHWGAVTAEGLTEYCRNPAPRNLPLRTQRQQRGACSQQGQSSSGNLQTQGWPSLAQASARTPASASPEIEEPSVGRAGAARAGCRLDAEATVRKPRAACRAAGQQPQLGSPLHLADQPVSYPETCKD